MHDCLAHEPQLDFTACKHQYELYVSTTYFETWTKSAAGSPALVTAPSVLRPLTAAIEAGGGTTHTVFTIREPLLSAARCASFAALNLRCVGPTDLERLQDEEAAAALSAVKGTPLFQISSILLRTS